MRALPFCTFFTIFYFHQDLIIHTSHIFIDMRASGTLLYTKTPILKIFVLFYDQRQIHLTTLNKDRTDLLFSNPLNNYSILEIPSYRLSFGLEPKLNPFKLLLIQYFVFWIFLKFDGSRKNCLFYSFYNLLSNFEFLSFNNVFISTKTMVNIDICYVSSRNLFCTHLECNQHFVICNYLDWLSL